MPPKKTGLGRSLKKDMKKDKRGPRSKLHTTMIEPVPMASITQMNDLDEIMMHAQMADRNFAGSREEASTLIISDKPDLVPRVTKSQKETMNEMKHKLIIPRRPPWAPSMSLDDIDFLERESFLDWRRGLSDLENIKGVVLTPFEKSLAIWRQLWRVVERSDVIVEIIDGRNPLLFHSPDLISYVSGLDTALLVKKHARKVLIVVNKADLLPEAFRVKWQEYFQEVGVDFVFFSAKAERDAENPQKESDDETPLDEDDNDSLGDSEEEEDEEEEVRDEYTGRVQHEDDFERVEEEEEEEVLPAVPEINTSTVLSTMELLALLLDLVPEPTSEGGGC